jgi:hypothetical protein
VNEGWVGFVGSATDYDNSYVRFYLRVVTPPMSNDEPIMCFYDSGPTNVKLEIRLTSTGLLAAYGQGVTLLDTGATTINNGTWYRIEVLCGKGAVAAPWEVKIDGVSEISGTADLINAGTQEVRLGRTADRNGESVEYYYDDFFWSDSTWPGAGQCSAMTPRGDGFTDWSYTGSSSWESVDTIPVGTSDYVYSTTNGQIVLVLLDNCATAGISGAIHSVKSWGYYQRDAGANGSILAQLISGSTTIAQAFSTGSAWAPRLFFRDTDPNTSSAWSTAALDVVKIGAASDNVNNSRCSSLLLMVDYDPSAPPASDPETNTNTIGKFQSSRANRNAFRYLWNRAFDESANISDLGPVIYSEVRNRFRRSKVNFRVFEIHCFGLSADVPTLYSKGPSGQYRTQNNNAEGYLLWVGVDAMPDYSQAADAFSATIPLVLAWPLPAVVNEVLYIVPRYRDTWGCISQNLHPWIIELSPTGQVLAPIPAPTNVSAQPRTNGNIAVFFAYPTLTLERNPANMVRVWVDTVPPDTNDPPTYQQNVQTTPMVVAFGTYTPGLWYVSVALYRSLDSTTSPVVTTTVTFPDLPDALEPVYTDNVDWD